VCDYPDHHFQRNLERFKKRCKEVMEEDIPQEKKELKVLGMVHILCRCYFIFKTDPMRSQYLKYAMVFLDILDQAMLKATTPMCIERFCIDLEYGKLLTDSFPDEDATSNRSKKGRKSKESWFEYGRRIHLAHSLAFYKTRVCNAWREPPEWLKRPRNAPRTSQSQPKEPAIICELPQRRRFKNHPRRTCEQLCQVPGYALRPARSRRHRV